MTGAMKPRHLSLVALAALSPLSCAPKEPEAIPPVTTARPTATTVASAATAPAHAASAPSSAVYAGHGAESVPPELLAKYAPTPLPSDVSRRIQAMLDVRAPVGGRVSPDGKNMYFAWNVTGTFQVWKLDGPRRFPVQLTGGEDVTRLASVTPDGKHLLVSRDKKGEENPGLYVLSADGGPLVEIMHRPKVQVFFEHVTDDSRYVYFRANALKSDSYALYRYDLVEKKGETFFTDDGLWSIEDHDEAGKKLLLSKATGALTSEKYEYDEATKKLTPLFGQNEKEEYQAMYGAAPGEILVRTAKLGEFRRVYRWKRGSGELSPVTPDVKMDVESMGHDRKRLRVYLSYNDGGYTRARALDAKTLKELEIPPFKDMDHVSFGAASADGRYVTLAASSAKKPSVTWLYDWNTKALVQWFVPSTPEVDVSRFAAPTLEHYPARDGVKIPMFVRRPAGCEPGASRPAPCPVVVHFHGGPEGQTRPGFSTTAQIFVDAGFVYVEPNVRGSDGYGKSWLHADDGPRRLDVITDIEDASKYVRTAWAGADKTAPKVGIMGGSYGGYSTLVGMTMFAGAYDAGVAIVGMSNLVSFLQNTAPYRRKLRASEYGDLDKDRDALVKLSPVTHIDKLSAPLLLIQGATDPRVPVGEAIQMHDALEKRGVTTKLIIFPDEGHGSQKRENKVIELGRTVEFFEANLKPKK